MEIPAHTVKKQLLLIAGTIVFTASIAAASFTGQLIWLGIPFIYLLLLAGWKNIAFLFYLLMFTIPFSSEFNFTASLGTDIPDEGLMLLLSLITGVYILQNSRQFARYLNHPLLLLLTAWYCWIIFTAAFSADPVVSAKYAVAKTWYLGAFVLAPLLLFMETEKLKKSAIVLAVSMLLVTILSLIRHALLGFRFAQVNEALQPFFRNHVNYSALLVCLIPVWVAVITWVKSSTLRRIGRGALLICLSALFFSYARGAWLALLVGIAGYVLIRHRIIVYAYLFVLLAAAISLFWLKTDDRYLQFAPDYQHTIFHEDFGEHMVATYTLRDMSAAERFHRWIAAIRMAADRPVTGSGPATFYPQYLPYTVPAFKTWVSDNPEHSTVHNYYLLMLTEQGIPGLFFWILLTLLMLATAQRLWHSSGERFIRHAAMTTGVIVLMLLTVNTLSDLIETDKPGALFYLSIGILATLDIRNRQAKKQ